MTTAVTRMYVWVKTYISMMSFSLQEWVVQNRVFAKVSAPGTTLEVVCTNSFVMSNNYPSLKIVMNPHTCTWQLSRSNSVMSTRLCAQTMLIVARVSSVLKEKFNGMILFQAGRFSINAKKPTKVTWWEFANWSAISRKTLESNMKQEELLTACPTIVSASFLLTLEELTLLRLLS